MISNDELKELHLELKPYAGFYKKDLVEKLNKRKKELRKPKGFNEGIVLNIFNGLVENPLIRAALMQEAKELLIYYRSKVEAAKKDVEQIKMVV